MPIFIAQTSPGSVCSGGTFSPETCRATKSPSSRRCIFLSSVEKISRGYFRGLKNCILQIFSFCWCCMGWKSTRGPSPSLLCRTGYRSGTTSLLDVCLQDAKRGLGISLLLRDMVFRQSREILRRCHRETRSEERMLLPFPQGKRRCSCSRG